ncbi:cytochrome P450 [Ophiobolus disseminans]|uniref:Cytochrome P450 n=1 Tax=Ophiobolus disseminans TaxID=1469910 RepID=A0A6A6ZPL9_9PLEO|nr:cytochrome P450 [Ophiobolus disseminans]
MLTTGANFTALLKISALLLLGYVFTKIVYNVFLHPLRSYPGPLLARATLLVYQREIMKGYSHIWFQDLHKKYGPVVRCSPNILSFLEPEVWKDVYGYKSPSFAKDVYHFYGPDPHGEPPGLLRADDISHARQRKLISNAFSDKALKEQEQLLKGYVQTLVERLTDIARGKDGGKTDIIEWYNFTTFDIMADLTFGEDLGQLRNSSYSPWVTALFGFVKFVAIGRIGRDWPGLTRLLGLLVPAEIRAQGETHLNFAAEKVDKRMARKTDRPDIWTYVMKGSDTEGKGLAPSELYSNGQVFMLGGTETTATLLSGLTYLLLKNPEKLKRLTQEVRNAFKSFNDMTMTRISQLEYLQACIDEGLRLYPPVAGSVPRIAPECGAKVCGRWVPSGTTVQNPIYAASRSPTNFKNPDTFAPERFLQEGATEYGSDKRDASSPFSYGPRNCVGKNLAYHEMRLILASLLLQFNIELCPEVGNWLHQKNFILWEKQPLLIKLSLAH